MKNQFRYYLLAALIGLSVDAVAQTNLQIHYKDGTHVSIPVEKIDSLTFSDTSDFPEPEASLEGTWLWGRVEAGYYELVTFNSDHTYTGYDNYFSMGFDAYTYGFYWQTGSMLSLQSNGFGYQRRFNWFVMGLSSNALEVMTQMGVFIYYRIQPEVIRLKVGESIPCAEGETIVFADGVTVSAEDNRLKALLPGTTYIQKNNTATNLIFSYKVLVE